METNYCKEICDDCTQECMKNKIYQEAKEIWSKQEKDLCDMIVAANNTIADLKESLRREHSYRLELIKQAECSHEVTNMGQCVACGYICIWEE